MATTDFSKQCEILGKFYELYRYDKEAEMFVSFNDVGLPLAYLSSEGLCEVAPDGERYIAESWSLFMASLDIEDQGFDSLDEVLEYSEK